MDEHLKGVRCRVCGYDQPSGFKTRFAKAGINIVACDRCSFTFIPPYYRKSIDYTDYKDERVLEQVRRGNNWLKVQRHLLRFKLIQRYARKGKLFDLGAGWGHFLLAGKQLGYQASGIELSVMPCRYAKDDLGLPVEQIDLFKMPRVPGAYDIVTLWDVLEHIDAADDVIDRCAEMISAGGHLFIQVPAIDSFFAKRQKEKWNMMTLDHVNYFSRATMTRLLNEKGFDVLEFRSSIELKLLLMYTVLPMIRKLKGRKEQKISSAERQEFYNRAVDRPKWMLRAAVFMHNIVYNLLSRLGIGEEMIVVARRR